MSKSLFKSTSLVSAMTLISRVFGFARDLVLAQAFGAVADFDVFLVAFKIPNFMRRLFAEGAFSQAFVPVLAEYRSHQDETAVQNFINHMASLLAMVLLGVTLLAMLCSPLLVMLFAPGFMHNPGQFALASTLLRITFPYLLLISLTAFSGAILNTYGYFSVPALTPVLLNIVLIVAALFIAPHLAVPVTALAWGVFIAGVVQLFFQWPFLKRLKKIPRFDFNLKDTGVKKVLKLMLAALFGVSTAQIGLLIDTLFASFLPAGSISWLYFSERLTGFPLGIFGVALATVVLPHLSKHHANQSPQAFSKTLDWALRCVLLISIPACLALIVIAGPILFTLLQYGKFNLHDVVMARKSLMTLSLGIPAFMLVKVLVSACYSQQNIRTPVRIAMIALLANVILNFVFMVPLAHAGLALASSLAGFLNAGLVWRYLLQQGGYRPQPGWRVFLYQLLFANTLLVIVLWLGAAHSAQWLAWNGFHRIWHLLLLCSIGIITYFISLWLMRLKFHEFYRA